MDAIRRIISGTATLLNLLLGTRLLWPPRPNGYRARLHRLTNRIRNNPDLLIDFIYSLRYPLALVTTLFAGAIVGYELFFRVGQPVLLGVKLAGLAFVTGMGVLTVGAGRVAKRLASFHLSAERKESSSKMTPLRRLVRHAFILHLYLLIGGVLLLALSILGIGLNLFSGTALDGYGEALLVFSILLLVQSVLILSQSVGRLRKRRVNLPQRSRTY